MSESNLKKTEAVVHVNKYLLYALALYNAGFEYVMTYDQELGICKIVIEHKPEDFDVLTRVLQTTKRQFEGMRK